MSGSRTELSPDEYPGRSWTPFLAVDTAVRAGVDPVRLVTPAELVESAWLVRLDPVLEAQEVVVPAWIVNAGSYILLAVPVRRWRPVMWRPVMPTVIMVSPKTK